MVCKKWSMKKRILNCVNVFAVPICFIIFVGLNYMFNILFFGEMTRTSNLFSVFWALLFCGILILLPTLARRIGIVLLITVFSLTCILHAVMYNLFGNFFAFSDLLYTEDGLAFFSFSYIKVRKLLLLLVIVCILISVLLAVSLKKQKYSLKNVVIGGVLLLISILGIYSQHGRFMETVSTSVSFDGTVQTDGDIYQTMSNKNYAMTLTGIYQYMYRSFMVSFGLEDRINNHDMYREIDEYYTSQEDEVHESNTMSGVFKGQNVFFIVLESIDTWMLTEEYMPNLYQVQQESINFANHYTPLYISAGTFNTEFMANTGIVLPTTTIDTKVYSENHFPYALANCFRKAGYSTNSFHGFNAHMYNRGTVHKNLGYNRYHNWEDMNMSNHRLDSQITNGYSKMVTDNPFFSFIITYSGHGPYTGELRDIPEARMEAIRTMLSRKQMNLSEKDLEEYTYAIAYAMETDDFVGNLLKKVEADNRLEDTVLIFFTDHYSKYLTNHDLIKELKGAQNEDFLCKTPFFIYQSKMEPRIVQTVSSTVDIPPTLANLFGLDVEYSYYAGVDVLGSNENYVVFPGNNWYDGECYYSVGYDGEIAEKIIERNKEISKKTKISEYILKSNYFKYIGDKR